MTTDTMERIYNRHTAALRMFASAGAISLQAVMLDLALALQELAETQGAMQQRRITELERNLEQLQLDIDAEVNDYRSQLAEANAAISNLQSQLTQLDADNAALIIQLDRIKRVLERHDSTLYADLEKGEIELPTAIDALISTGITALGIANRYRQENGRLRAASTDHPNGTAVTITPASAISDSMWSDPNTLTLLDAEARDWWIGCDAGRHTWRTVPKPIQLRIIRHILSFGPEHGSMPMTVFDAIKPEWLPSAGSHTKTLSLSWQQLNDWNVEL